MEFPSTNPRAAGFPAGRMEEYMKKLINLAQLQRKTLTSLREVVAVRSVHSFNQCVTLTPS